jgi:cytochrome c peroxidase
MAALLSIWAAQAAVGADRTATLASTRHAVSFRWKLPPGFPAPMVPADNPMSDAKVELGARLFRDTRLSVTGAYACESCHQPRLAFTDGRARAVGATGALTRHSAMSLANVAYNAAFTWGDPRVRTLERQMLQPLLNRHPVEMGMSGRERQVVELLSADVEYQGLFSAAFAGDPAPISIRNIVKAIAAFERTLISGRSPFDRYVFEDDESALSPSAKRGMGLFYSAAAGCAQCHSGLNFSGPIRYRGHPQAAASLADTGLGRMRVPTLRNVALTAPYMHDGSIATLNAVVDSYAAGGRRGSNGSVAGDRPPDQRIRPLHLSARQKTDLVAFLESLTDQEFVAAHLNER